MKKIAVIFGTRPDAIKLAPLIIELQKYPADFSVVTVATAQHRQMLDDVLSVFHITPKYDLNVMMDKQPLSLLTQTLLLKIDDVLMREKPDMVIVQGDTATTFSAAVSAFYQKIPVAHVEAGLRTNDKYNPFPEEIFRRLTSHTADLHFTPTVQAGKHLKGEGITLRSIFCSGNTVIDALQHVLKHEKNIEDRSLQKILDEKRKTIVVTTHRREHWGEPMKNICEAIRELAVKNDEYNFLFPVHLNPVVREVVRPILSDVRNVFLLEPLKYSDFAILLSRCYFVISDSGGLQEEAPSLGKPVLVLRSVTERPEAVKFGTVALVGTDKKKIVSFSQQLIDNKKLYRSMSGAVNPYGDGKASARIVSALRYYFGFSKKRLTEFTPRDR
jgi:UDP-N-acetylglucosamine 2-epimerase (non-hydrolysing)